MLPASMAGAIHSFMVVEGKPGSTMPGQGHIQDGLAVLDTGQQEMTGRDSPASGN